MDYKKYEALDKSRQKLLCFCAFIGGNIEPQSLKEYAKISSVALTKVTSYVKELTNGSFCSLKDSTGALTTTFTKSLRHIITGYYISCLSVVRSGWSCSNH